VLAYRQFISEKVVYQNSDLLVFLGLDELILFKNTQPKQALKLTGWLPLIRSDKSGSKQCMSKIASHGLCKSNAGASASRIH